jgi:putative DNA methylase
MTGGNCTPYGLTTWGDLFTPRQLVALTTFSDLVQEARSRVQRDALAAGLPDEQAAARRRHGRHRLCRGGGVYLAFSVSKAADYWSTICTWHSSKELIRAIRSDGKPSR